MGNPFHKSLDTFRGKRVRVTGQDGVTYIGWVERIHHEMRHVVLRGAERAADGELVGAVMVAHCETIEQADPDHRVEAIPLVAIEPSPYHVREFDADANHDYITGVADRGWVGSFPVVRPLADDGDLNHPGGDGFEIVAGHKRLWTAEQAGLTRHPVKIVELGDWAATRRWARDHLPEYDDAETDRAIDRLVGEWGEQAADLPFVGRSAVESRLGSIQAQEGPA